jgi:hypothetical protein
MQRQSMSRLRHLTLTLSPVAAERELISRGSCLSWFTSSGQSLILPHNPHLACDTFSRSHGRGMRRRNCFVETFSLTPRFNAVNGECEEEKPFKRFFLQDTF